MTDQIHDTQVHWYGAHEPQWQSPAGPPPAAPQPPHQPPHLPHLPPQARTIPTTH